VEAGEEVRITPPVEKLVEPERAVIALLLQEKTLVAELLLNLQLLLLREPITQLQLEPEVMEELLVAPMGVLRDLTLYFQLLHLKAVVLEVGLEA
jgi:hypothetical protein